MDGKASVLIDRKKIIETYDRIEKDAGGMWNANASMTIDRVAQELELPRDEVKDIMVSRWTNQGAG